jgi:hypothetical protein
VAGQSHELPIRCQLTSLGAHSVLMEDISLSTSAEPQRGHCGAGFMEVERYSSKRVSHAAQRYS